jgi:hypothetical protein
MLFLAPMLLAVDMEAASQTVPAPEVSDSPTLVPENETYAVGQLKIGGLLKRTWRIGDYAQVAYRCCWSKFGDADYDDRNDVETTWHRFSVEVTTSGGASAKAKAKSGQVSAVGYPDNSFGEELMDEILEENLGIDLWPDDPTYDYLKTVIRATITTTAAPAETWRIEAEKLPLPDGTRHLPGRLGYGELTNGIRTLDLTYRNVPPSSAEKCSEIILARDDSWASRSLARGDNRWAYCQRRITRVSEDGEWLADHDSDANEYVFRAGLDSDLKLLILAAVEIFRTEGGVY